MATALAALMSLPVVPLAPQASPVEELARLPAAVGGSKPPRVFIKRDDLLTFGCGGNKVRKMQAVAAEARAQGADTLITCGGVQSNHARVTAAAGAVLGLKVILVVNGPDEPHPTGNARLDRLFGADLRHVARREDRDPAMQAIAEELRSAGRRPFVVPLGASTATGALGLARGVAEIAAAGLAPDIIIHASSSGGTQAGLIAGCALLGLRARVVGVSADESAASLSRTVSELLDGMASRIGARRETIGGGHAIEVDDTQVGGGYGVPTPASTEAIELTARREGILLDPVYTAKAMAGLVARLRTGAFAAGATVLFWHTGGQPGYFA
jgi:1-aminocyclopropane-1-carboxylate deaminase/D-cysteine desulfhydrase-like pyridoxal-dependent ACC family enzyme